MSTLELSLLFLLAAVIGVVVFRMIHLPPMLGYLVVGIAIGPHAFALAADLDGTRHLAEFGVVFLMFSIGLEFSLPKLYAMKRIVFGFGFAQVTSTILIAVVGGYIATRWLTPRFGLPGGAALLALGGALAMSSTAIVVKMLTERIEIESEHGRRIVGVLLFQDLAVIPLLIVVPALASPDGELAQTLLIALAKAAGVLALLFYFGHKLLRGWFTVVARRRSQELFMLNLLLITLGLAWITELAGLSLALGAFVGGMLISETEYRHRVEEDIAPFRDVLLGLFFITIGMLLNVEVVLHNFLWVLALFVGPIALKLLLITGLAKAFGASPGVAIRTGLGLAQAGEFGFVLLNLAGDLKILDPLLLQIVLAAMLLSMLLAPFLIQYSERIALRVASSEWMLQSLALTQIASRTMATRGHVIVCGYGRSGQNLVRLLDQESIAYVALDLDPDRVSNAQAAGESVVYGDATRREALTAAGVQRAAALVITYAETGAAEKTLHFVHELAPHLPVIVRTHDDSHIDRLKRAGATEVVPEIVEGSLMLAQHALVLLGVPVDRVSERLAAARDSRYRMLSGSFRGADDRHGEADDARQVRMRSVTVPANSFVVGRSLAEIGIADFGVTVTAIRRRGIRGVDPAPDARLMAGDGVVLRGSNEALALAEQRLAETRPPKGTVTNRTPTDADGAAAERSASL
ncbi:MAG: cation:proton antiporter [Burkholderiaceae bacterium]